MGLSFSDLQNAVEQYFGGVTAQRKRVVAIINAIRERVVARDVPSGDVWYQSPQDTERDEDTAPAIAMNRAISMFPTESNQWDVDLVVHVAAPESGSYTRFYSRISIRFDSPMGAAHIFVNDEEIAEILPDSSPTNMAKLAQVCETLFQRMISSYEPGSENRRRIGFNE